MNITLSNTTDTITMSPPILRSTEKVACSDITDTDGQPYTLRIQTTMNETIHDAKTRCYIDISLADDASMSIIQAIDQRLISIVEANQGNKNWFGKRAPRKLLEKMYQSLVRSTKKTPHPFIRVKTDYLKGEPQVNHIVTCAEEDNTTDVNDSTSTTTSIITSLDDLKGYAVVYEVQLTGVRFCQTQFNPEFKLVSVQTMMDVSNYDMWNGLLNNENHCERKERILQRQAQMDEYEQQRAHLEALKLAVEKEVNEVQSRRESIDTQYTTLLETIEKARIAYEAASTGGEAVKDDVIVETLSPLEATTDTTNATDATDATNVTNVKKEETSGQVVDGKQEETTKGVVENATSTTETDSVNTVTTVAKVTEVAEVVKDAVDAAAKEVVDAVDNTTDTTVTDGKVGTVQFAEGGTQTGGSQGTTDEDLMGEGV